MPMNATCPNDTMPLLPMNTCIESTSITLTMNTTNVRVEAVDPNACTAASRPSRSAEMNAQPHSAGHRRLAGSGPLM